MEDACTQTTHGGHSDSVHCIGISLLFGCAVKPVTCFYFFVFKYAQNMHSPPPPSREISCKVQVLLLHRWLTVFTHIFISHIYTRTHARMLIHPGKKAEVVEVGKHVVTRSSPREPRGEQLWFQGVSRQPLPFARRSHRRHTHTHTQKISFLSHRQTAEVRSIIMMV